MQPMGIPVCPPIPPSLCLPGFSDQSWFHYPARSRLCPPALPTWSASSGHTLALKSSTNLFVSLLFYQLQLVIPHMISSAYCFPDTVSLSRPSCSSYLSVLPFPRLFTLSSSYNLSVPSLLWASVLHSTAFSNSPFPEACSDGQVLLFIAVSWSRRRPSLSMLESCSLCFSVKQFPHHATWTQRKDHWGYSRNGLYSQCLELDQAVFTAAISEMFLSALSGAHVLSKGSSSGILDAKI